MRCLKTFLFAFTLLATFPALAITHQHNKVKDDLQHYLDQARKANKVSGMQMTVILPSKEMITVTSGEIKQIQSNLVTPDTLFQIGSETKSYTAAVILQLQASGKLQLTDTLGKFLPEYTQWKDITISQLLHNNSGIHNYSEDMAFQKMIVNKPNYEWKPADLLAIAATYPLDFQPGAGWHYSNSNYILAGLIAEKASGQSLNQLYDTYFLKNPALKLNQTYYLPRPYPEDILHRIAHGYDEANKDITHINMSWAGAAGAMVSTSTNLAEWAYALFHHIALPEAALDEMLQLVSVTTGAPVTVTDDTGYGLGIGMRTSPKYGKWYGHEGETLGYHAIFIWFKGMNLTAAIIANGPAEKLRETAMALPGIVKT